MGSNHVDFGGISLPASATANSSLREVGYSKNAAPPSRFTFASSSDAKFKYTKAVAEGAVTGTATQAEAAIQENGVTVTTNRVRYGRTMTMEVVTNNALVDGQSFTVQAGSRTYSVGESGLNALTVSDGKQNSDGTYTYTLQLRPYTYKLFGNTNFVISLTGSNGTDVVSTQTIAVRVTLL